MEKQITVKVSGKSAPGKLAGYIFRVITDQQEPELHAIGAGAVNQAVKAIIIARRYVKDQGIDLICVPAFGSTEIEGRSTTTVKLIVKKCDLVA